MRACGLELAVSARFSYDTASPRKILVDFQPGLGKQPQLALARPLLLGGLTRPAGEGGVQAWPSEGGRILVIRLTAPDGTAEFDAPAVSVAAFLDGTYQLVPASNGPAREAVDDIAGLFAEGGTW